MLKYVVLLPLACGIGLVSAWARQDPQTCGTHAFSSREELFLHRGRAPARRAVSQPAADRDLGQIAVLGDGGGVVARRNPFNLDRKSLSFNPSGPAASSYSFTLGPDSFDPAAVTSGAPVALKDDDSKLVPLPFDFPYFGVVYREIFLNSDGNLTLGSGDSASADRSLGRLLSGPPRIAPLYTDLDPSVSPQGVRVLSEASRVTVTWAGVPAYSASGTGALQTFQVRLYPSGRIEMGWSGVYLSDAVVGISPGTMRGAPAVLSFLAGDAATYSAAVAERFSGLDSVDVVAAAQRFYQTHEDAYDYLVIYNSEGVPAGSGVVAFEVTARNTRSGIGDQPADEGAQYGSARRLQSVLNMGPLSQYPSDPNAVVPARALAGDTPLSVLGHEAGHLFLAFVSVPDPEHPAAPPMLGRSFVHWSFLFNSEASLLEGNRIRDNGPDAPNRFTTVGTVEGYSALDQYLMGFRAPEEVPPTFLVAHSPTVTDPGRAPQTGVSFDGDRRDISIQDVIAAAGPRIPASPVAQRRFRFAFLLVTPEGATPSAADLAKLEGFRAAFEQAYGRFTSNRASADATLKRALQVSLSPAAGVLLGSPAPATLTLDRPADAALTIPLRSEAGLFAVPESVTISAGESAASFIVTGLAPGVDSLIAEPADPSYEVGTARVQVAGSSQLKLNLISGDNQAAVPGRALLQPVVFKVTDANDLPYPGVAVRASAAGGGNLVPPSPSDSTGLVRLQWIPGTGPNLLSVSLPGSTPVTVAALGLPVVAGVANAASFVPGVSPGSIATVFGENLTAAAVFLNGQPGQVLYSNLRQLNFVAPAGLSGNSVSLSVRNAAGDSSSVSVPLIQIQPGLFAALNRGGYAEIYGTGLLGVNAPRVQIGGAEEPILYSGPAPGFPGLFQINAALPPGVPAGAGVVVGAGGLQSNAIPLQ